MSCVVISAKRLARLVTKEQVYVVIVSMVESVGEMNMVNVQSVLSQVGKVPEEYVGQVQELMQEFSDVFPNNLPEGLPPK